MDSLLRYFDMLCLIPKQPKSISTPELLEKLQSTGYDVDLRTVQRDGGVPNLWMIYKNDKMSAFENLKWQQCQQRFKCDPFSLKNNV